MRRYKPRRTYLWGTNLAYVAGLIAADGCLSCDRRHITVTSKDMAIITLCQQLLQKHAKVKSKTGQMGSTAYDLQFSDVALYDFLLESGITPAKSKIIQAVTVPDVYYADFLRGLFDGDGTVYGYHDKRWRSSYMHYTAFASASLPFLQWLQASNNRLAHTKLGKISSKKRVFVLTYAKQDSRRLFDFLYYTDNLPCLPRKYQRYQVCITDGSCDKIANNARVAESVDASA